MKIGNIEFGEYPLFLAPMEDVTDPTFRLLCKRFGADMVYSEFVSADALIRNVQSTERKLNINDEERPVVIQLYGRDPEPIAEAAKMAEAAHPDIIDLNFGCPVKKVAGKGGGAGLLKDIPKMLEIIKAVVKAVNTPVTVKTRLGWDENNKIISGTNSGLWRTSFGHTRKNKIANVYWFRRLDINWRGKKQSTNQNTNHRKW